MTEGSGSCNERSGLTLRRPKMASENHLLLEHRSEALLRRSYFVGMDANLGAPGPFGCGGSAWAEVVLRQGCARRYGSSSTPKAKTGKCDECSEAHVPAAPVLVWSLPEPSRGVGV